MDKGAYFEKGRVINTGQRFRYRLWRTWNPNHEKCSFIMLNPSTADAYTDDPTIRRCMAFAYSWGFGGIVIGNLFAHCAADPKEMMKVEDPIGWKNWRHLERIYNDTTLTIAAWGNLGVYRDRWLEVVAMMPELYHLGLTKSGQPRHPLYLKKSVKPIRWDI